VGHAGDLGCQLAGQAAGSLEDEVASTAFAETSWIGPGARRL
jgi:hypothetical protein